MSATTERTKLAAGDRVWLIEEDGTHTSAVYLRPTLAFMVVTTTDGGESIRCWNRSNVIDHETGLRLSELRNRSMA